MRVVLVDDDAYVRVVCSLGLPDVEIVEAVRLEDGYDAIVNERPDAVVVDRHLGDGDGLELVRHIRSLDQGSLTPVLVVTAGHDEKDRLEVLISGADEYLAKPVDPDDLRRRLEHLVALADEARWSRRIELVGRAVKDRQTGADTAAAEGPAGARSLPRGGLGGRFRRRSP